MQPSGGVADNPFHKSETGWYAGETGKDTGASGFLPCAGSGNKVRSLRWNGPRRDPVSLYPLYLPGVPKGVRISAESENGDVDTKEYTVSENPVLARDSSVVYTIYGVYEDTEEMIRVLIYDPSVLN